MEDARRAASDLLKLDATLSATILRRRLPFRRAEDANRFAEGLGKAGLPI